MDECSRTICKYKIIFGVFFALLVGVHGVNDDKPPANNHQTGQMNITNFMLNCNYGSLMRARLWIYTLDDNGIVVTNNRGDDSNYSDIGAIRIGPNGNKNINTTVITRRDMNFTSASLVSEINNNSTFSISATNTLLPATLILAGEIQVSGMLVMAGYPRPGRIIGGLGATNPSALVLVASTGTLLACSTSSGSPEFSNVTITFSGTSGIMDGLIVGSGSITQLNLLSGASLHMISSFYNFCLHCT